ncbi:hypothetical protein BPOR_0425g00020 [Botrytis porri]|uniref:Uncharacterized protein n=1 Tax=Botrytis porri TaxID=87229 RepID=A0A4Z1KS08_9HELO|nr:hypothetical protein BPOR_0425g00020 [Botrytis porri]
MKIWVSDEKREVGAEDEMIGSPTNKSYTSHARSPAMILSFNQASSENPEIVMKPPKQKQL